MWYWFHRGRAPTKVGNSGIVKLQVAKNAVFHAARSK